MDHSEFQLTSIVASLVLLWPFIAFYRLTKSKIEEKTISYSEIKFLLRHRSGVCSVPREQVSLIVYYRLLPNTTFQYNIKKTIMVFYSLKLNRVEPMGMRAR